MSSKYSRRQSINLITGKRKSENNLDNLVEDNNDNDINLSFDHPHHNNGFRSPPSFDNILLPKLSQHLLGVLNDEEYYDIIIEVGNDPYKNYGTLTHIKLPNISPETFQIILRYIYGGRLPLKEYDNLDMIKLLFATNLKYCVNLISKELNKILNSPDLSSISEKLLISIIQNDNLQMSDIQIWEYVLKWGIDQNPELPSDIISYSKDDFNILKNTLQQSIPFTFLNLLNHLDPDSKPNNKSKLENFDITKEIDSRIITYQHAKLISQWINRLEITDKLTSPFEIKLLFCGSRDGFTHSKFHEMCDNQSCTVTIVKVKYNNEILGGYNPIEWKSITKFTSTKDSFIFSFNNNDRIENYILSRVMNKKI
ncbi:hypothetical protein C1645_833412 [Glomus cerebriforme]|uniref:TLDc domain-containing protein n=1 Tax=Glomus cerebriforme TaxID=658196 RepID=A0A397SBL8_9GLOM|nr:hypothetical protein C1645_833412 [Glomus cerebriforme]